MGLLKHNVVGYVGVPPKPLEPPTLSYVGTRTPPDDDLLLAYGDSANALEPKRLRCVHLKFRSNRDNAAEDGSWEHIREVVEGYAKPRLASWGEPELANALLREQPGEPALRFR